MTLKNIWTIKINKLVKKHLQPTPNLNIFTQFTEMTNFEKSAKFAEKQKGFAS